MIVYVYIAIIQCLIFEQQDVRNNNHIVISDTSFKDIVNFFLDGFKNLARIGRIIKWEKVFFKTPTNRIKELSINEDEKLLLYKLAILSSLTYMVDDYAGQELLDHYSTQIDNYRKRYNIRNVSADLKNTGIFEIIQSNKQISQNSLKSVVFANNKITIIAYKGTSPQLFGYNTDDTSENDKYFDNIAFDCNTTIKQITRLFYLHDAKRIYLNMKQRFPNNQIILTGHSMGAAIASIIGNIYNEYVVAFGTPGDEHIVKKFIKQKHKKQNSTTFGLFKKMNSNVLHFGDCNDVIYRGVCDGFIDVCRLSGYNIKTKCHSGRTLCFDNTGRLSILKHTIHNIVEKLKLANLKMYEIDETDCYKNDCLETIDEKSCTNTNLFG